MKALLDGLRATVTGWWGARRECASILVTLPRGTLWSHQVHSSELTVTCLEGWIWVTREGDAKDHVLTAGRSLQLDTPGRVVVQALRPSRFSMGRESPGAEPMPPPCRAVGR
ncbi:MAG TPA: DUF2917 domain-containing protein [Myxococcaceae bacterium]|jgi:hypothetical protein